MNQQIKQLANEAGFMDSWFSESGDDCERELKKFAELIVRECADVADNADATREKWQSIGKFVKEHFGVEE